MVTSADVRWLFDWIFSDLLFRSGERVVADLFESPSVSRFSAVFDSGSVSIVFLLDQPVIFVYVSVGDLSFSASFAGSYNVLAGVWSDVKRYAGRWVRGS